MRRILPLQRLVEQFHPVRDRHVRAGFELTPVPDSHLCCGSAGTYSILQPELAAELRRRKLAALQSGQPVGIVTANIGCLMHLQAGAGVPVAHWVELLDEAMQG